MNTESYSRRSAIYDALVADMATRAGTSPLSSSDSAALIEASEAERGALLALCTEPAATFDEVQERASILADLAEAEIWEDYQPLLAKRISDDLARLSSPNVMPLKRIRHAG
ncbi:MAG: hypothetical protein LCH80_01280 [Proteobacteria bacterium]|nr:hypothetical protein [Pseudomonadota bacterium]